MTAESTPGSGTFLENQVDKAYELYLKQQAHINRQQCQQEQKRSELDNRLAQQEIAGFAAMFAYEFEPELFSQLNPVYSLDGEIIKAAVCYSGIRWNISRHACPTWKWKLQASLESDPTHCYSNLSVSVERLSLSKMVLLLFAMGEQQRADEREQEVRQEQEALAREIQKQQAIENAQLEDEALRRELEALRDKKAQEMWRWPERGGAYIYRCAYAVPKGTDASGLLVYAQEDGWCIEDQPDPTGYILLEETSDDFSREVRLDPSNRPLWFRHRITSIDDLPECLRRRIYVSIPDIVEREDPLDGVLRLKRVAPDNMYYGEKPYQLEVGIEPLSWIQRLVDQQVDGFA